MEAGFDRVRAKGLVKMFGATRALSGVSLSFDSGCVTVVEGPNGSGKSTLLAILAQLAQPTRGEVLYVAGAKARRDVRRHIGVLAHASMLYPDLTGHENLELFGAMYALADPRRRVAELVDRFEIGKYLGRPVRTYSRGQLQKVALARSVLHSPKLLLLDEPSTGLDDGAVRQLEVAVRQEREAGTILVLVTHDHALAERLGDRFVTLERGKVASTREASRSHRGPGGTS